MQFDFGEFEISQRSERRKTMNMEELMQKVDIDWQNFEQFDNKHEQVSKSSISDIFDRQKSMSQDKNNISQANLSRDIHEISYIYPKAQPNNSFRFESNIQPNHQLETSRYQRVKMLLSKAKQNSLDAFYKNLDKINEKPQQPHQFKSKEEFKDHILNLKLQKRDYEDHYKPKIIKNDPIVNKMISSPPQADFSKKQSNYLLPQDYLNDDHDDEHFKDMEQGQYQPKQLNGIKQARQFFDSSSPNVKKKKSQKKQKKKPLDIIRQEKPTIFQKTIQEQKLNTLLQNYQQMRNNFDQLIHQLKDTNHGQQKIVNQLKKIKQQCRNQQKQQQRMKKKIQKQQILEIKKQQFQQIKQQINKIKQTNKDLLYLKINQKIQTLESAVKSALEQIVQEKIQPFTPKIINYFCQPAHQHTQSNVEFSNESISDRARRDNQHQAKVIITSRIVGQNNHLKGQNIISPFDVPLQQSGHRYFQDDHHLQSAFCPPEFAKQHYPKKIDTVNKNLRRSLTQKSSLVYESFQFHVSAKFTVIENQINPLKAQIRIGNKCLISLSDVFAIVYGPQGSDLIVKPSKIYNQVLKPDSCFNFQVLINKPCLEDNGFYVQISYKTDSMAKKRINTKIPLPLIQLIEPQFIYQEQFIQIWDKLSHELYIPPKTLDFIHIRSHEDFKLILPFTHITQKNPNLFSYGIMFHYPKCDALFLMKLVCMINGKASIQLRSDRANQQKIKQQILDTMNFLLFSES